MKFPNQKIGFGDYIISVQVNMSTNPDYYFTALRGIVVRWHENPEFITALDKAIEQHVYIAKPEELN